MERTTTSARGEPGGTTRSAAASRCSRVNLLIEASVRAMPGAGTGDMHLRSGLSALFMHLAQSDKIFGVAFYPQPPLPVEINRR